MRVGPVAELVEARRRSPSALLAVGLDVRGAQCLRVPGRVRDLDRPRREPVPVRALADDPRRVEHREPPAHGPRETKAAVVPAHRLREARGRGRARRPGRAAPRRAACPATATPRKPSRSSSSSAARRGASRTQPRPSPHRDRRSLHPLVRGLRRDVVGEHGQPARRDEDLARLHPETRRASSGSCRSPRGRPPRAAPRSRSQSGASPSAPT